MSAPIYLPAEYEPALLGHTVVPGNGTVRALYDVDEIIEILQTVHGLDHTEAWEWFDFNIAGTYLGEATPLYLFRVFRNEPGQRPQPPVSGGCPE